MANAFTDLQAFDAADATRAFALQGIDQTVTFETRLGWDTVRVGFFSQGQQTSYHVLPAPKARQIWRILRQGGHERVA